MREAISSTVLKLCSACDVAAITYVTWRSIQTHELGNNRSQAEYCLRQPAVLHSMPITARPGRRILPSLTNVCLSLMPTVIADLTSLCRVTSSSRLSIGKAMAFSCTMLSTITRSNSTSLIAPPWKAVSIVAFQRCLNSSFTNVFTKAPDLTGITWRSWLIEVFAADKLAYHFLQPVLDELAIAEVESMFETQQGIHQSDI
jgi:hypothetical protein